MPKHHAANCPALSAWDVPGACNCGGRTIHVSLVVRDAIAWPDRELKNLVSDENDDRFTPQKAREWLADHLSRGHEYLPIGKRCKGFTYRAGCPGHAA